MIDSYIILYVSRIACDFLYICKKLSRSWQRCIVLLNMYAEGQLWEVSFTKMHGLGNSYIYVNMFKERLAEEELSYIAKRVANVHTGIGSDGLILICPSDVAPVKMRIFNSDGSEGKIVATGCDA